MILKEVFQKVEVQKSIHMHIYYYLLYNSINIYIYIYKFFYNIIYTIFNSQSKFYNHYIIGLPIRTYVYFYNKEVWE